MDLLITDCELEGRHGVDVAIAAGQVVAVERRLRPQVGTSVLNARGGALLPGLHDHHVHLRALAASAKSVAVDPPAVGDSQGLATALRRAAAAAAPGAWVRAVGYHEMVAGELDRWRLDAMVGGTPVRVQHATGQLWMLNSAALARLPLSRIDEPHGVERDDDGTPTGRLWHLDGWLRSVVDQPRLDVAAVGRTALTFGVTGFTDADPDRDEHDLAALTTAVADGQLPQRVCAMVPPDLRADGHPRLSTGPVKVLLHDEALPSLADLAATMANAHHRGRAAAVHCVTRAQLLLTLAAFEEAGTMTGDRIEHGSVIPPTTVGQLARLDLWVVTQPNFVAERGDRYRADMPNDEHDDLYRCRTLLDDGVTVAAGTDAPFGGADPWAAVAAATRRRTASGAVLGPRETVDGHTALGLFLGSATRPGRPRRVVVGAVADLCLLSVPIAVAMAEPSRDLVRATIIDGQLRHDAEAGL